MKRPCFFLVMQIIVLIPTFVLPQYLRAQALLEDPQQGSFQSGIGLIRGWRCDPARIEIEIDGIVMLEAAYGTSRADTRSTCGDDNNGFGLTFNWNLLGDGKHTVRALADGVEFGRATFTVATLGVEFLRGANGSFRVVNFPKAGSDVIIRWQESAQNFVIEGIEKDGVTPPPPPPPPGG